jgi:hypothetical protein
MTDDFFRARLDQMIDLKHLLAVLAQRMPWGQIETALKSSISYGRLQTASVAAPSGHLEKPPYLGPLR